MQSDAVARGCVVHTEGCTLIHKCEECKIEVAKLIAIDDMFVDYFKQLEYLKTKLESDIKRKLDDKKSDVVDGKIDESHD